VSGRSGGRPFRFSLQVGQVSSSKEHVELARRAEDSGFDLVVAGDHLTGCAGPMPSLGALAGATSRIRIGTMVSNNDFQHPALLARDAATLDVVSDGRLELGLGAGQGREEYERARVAIEPIATRLGHLEESLVILRRLLDGEIVTHRGQHYSLLEHSCEPRPVQTHLPIIAGGGGDRVLALAARRADAVGFTGLRERVAGGGRLEPSGFPAARVEEQVNLVRSEAGSRLDDLELQVLVQAVVPSEHPRSAAESIAARALPALSAEDVLATPYLMVGTRQRLTEALLANRERWGFSHYTVRARALGRVEPVVADLSGR
jgi:probable F420-dependent oxidoreductase